MSYKSVAISVRDVSKHYLLFERPEDRLKQSIVPRLQRLVGRPPRRYYRDFAALNGITFDVHRGETVGIIGRNGCGKSTLLQLICGILLPSSGTVEVNGRIAALLELGSGFNPEFTGRENVYMNGAILGLSQAEINERFDAIAAFADIGAFIEEPVKTYSSGMYVRLAFAVAISVDPDILVVDEALAVGDEAFQRKCFARIEQIQERGGTILFVSHAAQSIVQLCSRALLLDGGELILEGRPKTVVSQYQRLVNLGGAEAAAIRHEIRQMNEPLAAPALVLADENAPAAAAAQIDNDVAKEDKSAFDPSIVSESTVAYESHGARIRDLRLTTQSGRQVNVLQPGRTYDYEYVVDFDRPAEQVGFGMLVKTVSGLELGGAATDNSANRRLAHVAPGDCLRVRFTFLLLLTPGTYFLNAGVTGVQAGSSGYLHRLIDALAFRVVPAEGLLATGYVDFRPQVQVQPITVRREDQLAMPECETNRVGAPGE